MRLKSSITFILMLFNLLISAQMSTEEYILTSNLIFNEGMSPPYHMLNANITDSAGIDSLKRLQKLDNKSQIIQMVDLLKNHELDERKLDFLMQDSLTHKVLLLDSVNNISLAYFIWACEAIIANDDNCLYTYQSRFYDKYFQNSKYPAIAAFATLKVVEGLYRDRSKSGKSLLPQLSSDSSISRYHKTEIIENNVLVETLRKEVNIYKKSELKAAIETCNNEMFTVNSQYYSILLHILTMEINSQKDWEKFKKFGENVLKEKQDSNVFVGKRRASFQTDFRKAYCLRFINSDYFSLNDLEFISGIMYNNSGYINSFLLKLKPELYTELMSAEYQKTNSKNIFIPHTISNPYKELLANLYLVRFIGHTSSTLQKRIDYLLF